MARPELLRSAATPDAATPARVVSSMGSAAPFQRLGHARQDVLSPSNTRGNWIERLEATSKNDRSDFAGRGHEPAPDRAADGCRSQDDPQPFSSDLPPSGQIPPGWPPARHFKLLHPGHRLRHRSDAAADDAAHRRRHRSPPASPTAPSSRRSCGSAQLHGDLPGPGRSARLHRRLQQRQALCRRAARARSPNSSTAWSSPPARRRRSTTARARSPVFPAPSATASRDCS